MEYSERARVQMHSPSAQREKKEEKNQAENI